MKLTILVVLFSFLLVASLPLTLARVSNLIRNHPRHLEGFDFIAAAESDGPFGIAGVQYANQQAFIDSGARCGTKEPSDAFKANDHKTCPANKNAASSNGRSSTSSFHAKIGVYVHVIIDPMNGEGAITQQAVDEQIQVLNNAFAAAPESGISFYLAQVNCVASETWYNQPSHSAALTDMKKTLHQGGPYSLNLYFTKMSDGVLGYATYPLDDDGDGKDVADDEEKDEDGVILLTGTEPGGSVAPYNLGYNAGKQVLLYLFFIFELSRAQQLYPCCLTIPYYHASYASFSFDINHMVFDESVHQVGHWLGL